MVLHLFFTARISIRSETVHTRLRAFHPSSSFVLTERYTYAIVY